MVLTNNFEDGSTQGWGIGNSTAHPNPPTNVASGGPEDGDHNFLKTQANGSAGVDASSLAESSFEIVPNVATVEDALTIL